MLPPKPVYWDVDTQRDFMLPGGALYVPGAEKLIPNLKRLVDEAGKGQALLVSSGDAHAPDDPEFQNWPPHCVRGTMGADRIPETQLKNALVVPNCSAFQFPVNLAEYAQIILEKQTLDVFDNPNTATLVNRLGTEREFFLFGVVTEYCVRCAAKGLLERGRRVSLVTDATETLKPEDGRKTIEELRNLGARFVSTEEAVAAAHQSLAAEKAGV